VNFGICFLIASAIRLGAKLIAERLYDDLIERFSFGPSRRRKVVVIDLKQFIF